MEVRQNQRFVKFISYLQITGIILVVLGHSFHEYPDGSNGTSLLMYRMMYNFRMPLFIFVSGFLMYYTTRMGFKKKPGVAKFVTNKLKRLIVPYLVLSIVTFVPRAFMSGMADSDIELNLSTFVTSIFDGGNLVIPYFWFIQASFLLLVVCYTSISLMELARIPHSIILVILLIIAVVLILLPYGYTMFFSVGKAAELAVFFVLGMIYCRCADAIDCIVPWTSILFFIISGGAWAAAFFLTEGTVYSPLASLLGIAMCISAAKILVDRNLRFLDHLIGANYIIFLLSWFCNVFSQQVLHHFTDFPWYVYTVLSLVSGIYIPWLGYVYLQNHPDSRWVRFSAFILGQSLKKPSR